MWTKGKKKINPTFIHLLIYKETKSKRNQRKSALMPKDLWVDSNSGEPEQTQIEKEHQCWLQNYPKQ